MMIKLKGKELQIIDVNSVDWIIDDSKYLYAPVPAEKKDFILAIKINRKTFLKLRDLAHQLRDGQGFHHLFRLIINRAWYSFFIDKETNVSKYDLGL